MNTRLVLDYLTGRTRIYQPHEIMLPVWQAEWEAHTEPDMLRGRVWLSLDEPSRIMSSNAKHNASNEA